MPPLGWPIRKEDWYYITDTLVSATVTVYSGELVGCTEATYNRLITKGKMVPDQEGESEEVYLVQYGQMREMLERNGFKQL